MRFGANVSGSAAVKTVRLEKTTVRTPQGLTRTTCPAPGQVPLLHRRRQPPKRPSPNLVTMATTMTMAATNGASFIRRQNFAE